MPKDYFTNDNIQDSDKIIFNFGQNEIYEYVEELNNDPDCDLFKVKRYVPAKTSDVHQSPEKSKNISILDNSSLPISAETQKVDKPIINNVMFNYSSIQNSPISKNKNDVIHIDTKNHDNKQAIIFKDDIKKKTYGNDKIIIDIDDIYIEPNKINKNKAKTMNLEAEFKIVRIIRKEIDDFLIEMNKTRLNDLIKMTNSGICPNVIKIYAYKLYGTKEIKLAILQEYIENTIPENDIKILKEDIHMKIFDKLNAEQTLRILGEFLESVCCFQSTLKRKHFDIKPSSFMLIGCVLVAFIIKPSSFTSLST